MPIPPRRRPDIVLIRILSVALAATLVLPILHATGRPPAAMAQSGGPWLVSHTPAGGSAGGDSLGVSISGDGQRVAFESTAADLAPGDADTTADVFVYDRDTDWVRRVSQDAAGAEVAARTIMPSLSADGRWLAFRSEAALTADAARWGGLYLRDLAAGGGIRLIVADANGGRGANYAPAVAGDGARVVFESTAVLAGAPADGMARVFGWDREGGRIFAVSPVDADAPARDPAISDDGSTAAFVSAAANIAAPRRSSGAQVYVVALDILSGGRAAAIERVSVATGGVSGDGDSAAPALSGDGRIVAFGSLAQNLVVKDVNGVSDIFVHDRGTGETVAVTDVTPADDVHHPGASVDPDLSPDGRWLVFASEMYTLTPGDTNRLSDVYRFDRTTRQFRLLSRKADGGQSDNQSWGPAAADGGVTAFVSSARLVAGDAGDFSDAYLAGPGGGDHPQASATPVHHDPTATPTPTSTSNHATATVVHRPTWTATPDGHHPTATPGPHDPTATIVHRPTWTPTPGHHPSATPGPHDPTSTPDPHRPTATPGPHDPTATIVHRPTWTPTPGARVLPQEAWRLALPVLFNGGG